MPAQSILALDFGSTTGWAIRSNDGIYSGTWDLRPRRGDSPGMRYVLLRRELNTMIGAWPELKLVVYEMPHHRGGAATEYALGWVATCQAWCAEWHIEHQQTHSATVKKAITGSGRASKEDVLRAVRELFPNSDIRDDNQADALAILKWAIGADGLAGDTLEGSRSGPQATIFAPPVGRK